MGRMLDKVSPFTNQKHCDQNTPVHKGAGYLKSELGQKIWARVSRPSTPTGLSNALSNDSHTATGRSSKGTLCTLTKPPNGKHCQNTWPLLPRKQNEDILLTLTPPKRV